jgi:hypothetical protein
VVAALGSSSAAAIHRRDARAHRPSPAARTATAPDAVATTAALADAAQSTGPGASYGVARDPAVVAPAGSRPADALQVSLRVRQLTVAVGDLVEADLGVDDADGVPAEYVLDWGDQRARPNRPATPCGSGAAARVARPTHWRNRVEYSYREAGRYTVVYRMRTQGCASAAAEEQVAQVVVTVVDGRLPTNGGRRPHGFLSVSNRDATVGGTVVDVQGQDLDGWVTRMVVDFGDGTPARLVENPHTCVAPRGEWPATPYFSHRYEAPYRVVGTYTVTLTVFAAGCDGRDGQQTTVRQQVVVPAAA